MFYSNFILSFFFSFIIAANTKHSKQRAKIMMMDVTSTFNHTKRTVENIETNMPKANDQE